MKRLGFLIAFIFTVLGCFYIFAIPPILTVILKAEISKKDITIDKIGNVRTGFGKITIDAIELSKNDINVAVETVILKKHPLALLITRQANSVEIIAPQIYIDTTQDKKLNTKSARILESAIKSPHQYTSTILQNSAVGLRQLAPVVSFKKITIDSYTPYGLLTVKGDVFVKGSDILGSFTAAQKPLTFNAQIKGTINDNVTLNAQIDNVNLNLGHISTKRASGKINYQAQKADKSGIFELTGNAGLLRINDLSLSRANLKTVAEKSENKIYLTAQHSANSQDLFEYWHNYTENGASAYMQARNIQPRLALNFFADLGSKKQSFLDKFFIYPTDVTTKSSYTKNQNIHELSVLPVEDTPLFRAKLINNDANPLIYINNFEPSSTQLKALAYYYLDANIHEAQGNVSLSGSFQLDQKNNKIIAPTQNKDILTLRMKNASFKGNNININNLSGALKLIQDTEHESSLSYNELDVDGAKLKNGRVVFSLNNHGTKLKVDQIRSTIGNGTLVIKKNPDTGNYQLSGRRVNAKAIPRLFWPDKTYLQDLVDVKGQITPLSTNNIQAELNYKRLINSKTSQKTISADANNERYNPYLKYFGKL